MRYPVSVIVVIIVFCLLSNVKLFAYQNEFIEMSNPGNNFIQVHKKSLNIKNNNKYKNGDEKDYYLVTSERLIIKDLPYETGKNIGILARGDTINVIGFMTVQDEFDLISKFLKLNYKGQVGYVDAKFTKHVVTDESQIGPPIDKFSVYTGLSFLVLVILIGTFDQ